MLDRVNVNRLVTAAQVRAARGWLGWSQDDLASKSGVSQRSIARFELERSVPYVKTLARIRRAFEGAGICFQFDGLVAKGIRIP
ncbi:MAG: XRE family transcriptional regulator [Bradyrhizobiaceae bacterium]|nr:MAG: XRE family transcriptional regulator [Bradyrhizobiaceae bacterium]